MLPTDREIDLMVPKNHSFATLLSRSFVLAMVLCPALVIGASNSLFTAVAQIPPISTGKIHPAKKTMHQRPTTHQHRIQARAEIPALSSHAQQQHFLRQIAHTKPSSLQQSAAIKLLSLASAKQYIEQKLKHYIKHDKILSTSKSRIPAIPPTPNLYTHHLLNHLPQAQIVNLPHRVKPSLLHLANNSYIPNITTTPAQPLQQAQYLPSIVPPPQTVTRHSVHIPSISQPMSKTTTMVQLADAYVPTIATQLQSHTTTTQPISHHVTKKTPKVLTQKHRHMPHKHSLTHLAGTTKHVKGNKYHALPKALIPSIEHSQHHLLTKAPIPNIKHTLAKPLTAHTAQLTSHAKPKPVLKSPIPKKRKPSIKYRYNLTQVLHKTLATNPEILAERANWLRNKHLVRQAKGLYYPSIDVQYGAGREVNSNTTTRQAKQTQRTLSRRTSSIVLTQLLFDGGSRRSQVRAAQENTLAAKYRFANVQQVIILGTIESYINVLRFSKLQQLARGNIEAHVTALNKVTKRFKAGAGRSSDIELATARLALARATLQTVTDSYNSAHFNFIRLTGITPKNLQPITLPSKRLPHTLSYAERLGIRNNPAIREAQAQIRSAHENITRAKTAFYPRFNLNLSTNHNMDIGGIQGSNNSQQATIEMNYNLLNGGADQAATKAAIQEHINSQENYMNTRRSVLEKIRVTWHSFKINKKRIPYLKVHFAAMKKTASNYREQFKLGQRSLLDELNADTEAFNAENNVVDAKYQLIISAYALLFETGQLTHSES